MIPRLVYSFRARSTENVCEYINSNVTVLHYAGVFAPRSPDKETPKIRKIIRYSFMLPLDTYYPHRNAVAWKSRLAASRCSRTSCSCVYIPLNHTKNHIYPFSCHYSYSAAVCDVRVLRILKSRDDIEYLASQSLTVESRGWTILERHL